MMHDDDDDDDDADERFIIARDATITIAIHWGSAASGVSLLNVLCCIVI